MQQLHVILADSSPVVLLGFKSIVEKNPRTQIVEEVTSLPSLEAALACHPGCVSIVEWALINTDATAELAQKTLLLLSAMPESIATRHQALRLGVRGFLGRHQSAADIRKAVLTVARGQIWVGETTAEALLSHHLSTDGSLAGDGDGLSRITARERQVIQMACQGLKSRAIAAALRISEPTVAHHFTSIYSKLEVEDRVGLVIFAHKHSLHVPAAQLSPNRLPAIQTVTNQALTNQAPARQIPGLQASAMQSNSIG